MKSPAKEQKAIAKKLYEEAAQQSLTTYKDEYEMRIKLIQDHIKDKEKKDVEVSPTKYSAGPRMTHKGTHLRLKNDEVMSGTREQALSYALQKYKSTTAAGS